MHWYKVIGKYEDGKRVGDIFHAANEAAAKEEFLNFFGQRDFVAICAEQLED